jgi:hypothetical protein
MEELNELQKECSPQTLTPHTAASQPSQEKNHNDLTIFFNQDQFNIIKQWRKIHRFLFKHGIYALMLLLGTVSVYILTLFTQDTKIATEENFSEKEHLAAQQENINKQVPELSGLTIDILYGKLTLEKSILSSVSNLATYQEIVLPRVAEISTTKPLFDWEKFNNNQTSPTDISKLIQQLIIAPANKNSALPKETILTLSQGIISDFNLQCL